MSDTYVDPQSASTPFTTGQTHPDGSSVVNLDAIMKAFTDSQQNYATSLAGFNDQINKGQGALTQDQAGIRAQAKVDQATNAIQGDAAAKLQRDNAAASAAFGTNPDASSYVLAALGESIRGDEENLETSQKQLIANRQNIQQRLNTGMLDDPLGWMVNQFTLPQDVYAQNYAEETFNLQVGDMNRKLGVAKELMDRTREAAATNSIVDQADATRLAQLKDQGIAIAAQRNLAESQLKSAQLGIQGIQLKDAVTKGAFDNLIAVNRTQNEAEQLSMERTKTDLATQQKNLMMQYRQDQIDAKNGDLQAKTSIQQRLDSVSITLGTPRVSYEEFLKMTGRMKDIYEQFINDPDVVQGRLGHTTAGALNNANAVNAPLTPGANQIRAKLEDWRSQVITSHPEWNGLKQDEKDNFTETYFNTKVKQELLAIPSEGGVYSPPSLRAVLGANESFANLEISKDLAPLLKADPDLKTDPNMIFKSAMKLIENGTMTPAQASQEVAILYQGAMITNNQIHQYNKFAMPRMDSTTTGFKQNVYLGGGWGTAESVDMSNAARVESALTRSVISRQMQKETAGIAGGAL